MKKIVLFLFALAINFLIANATLAENFYIKNYDVEMKVAENKTISITESIDVYFTDSAHGIYRKIPIKNKVVRADDSTYTNYADIKNISINNQFTTNYQNNYLVITIGSPTKLVNGDQRYVIKYEYTPSDDKMKDNDELYFNIIGTEWNTKIEKSSFFIEMPYSFDTKNLGLSIGTYGTVGYNKDEAELYSNGKTIEGNIFRTLSPNEGVTIRLLLPKNYFIIEKKSDILAIFIIIILTGIIYFLWYRYGKDNQIIPVVTFYPPERRNSAEISVEYKGSASDKALVSLIIYLASKGYIRIDDTGKTYSLHKLKEYDGNNPVEKGLMKALFSGYDYVSKEDLEKSTFFYEDCKRLKDTLNKIKNKIFEKEATSWDKLAIIGICIFGIILSIFYSFNNNSFNFLTYSDITKCLICFFIIGVLFFVKTPRKNIISRIITMIWTISFISAPMLNEIFSNFKNHLEEHLLIGIIGITSLIISTICLINMPKRNMQGTKKLGEILGFKKFLEVAEQNRIKKLIEENPAYCYDVLPYAYVLDVSEEWISKFESLTQEQPSWYTGQFSSRRFTRIMSSLEANTVPSVENGGITISEGVNGGGGFAGGGCGGGGGGSW